MNESDASATFPNAEDESEMLRLCKRGRIGAARVRLHKGKYWELDFAHPGGVHLARRRRYCTSPTHAVREARRITKELREHGTLARALSTSQRWIAAECFRRLAKIGSEDPSELLAVVDTHLKRHPLGGNARTLDDLRVEVVAKKKKKGCSQRHIEQIDYKLRKLFAVVGPKPITAITTADLAAELENHPHWKPSTIHSAVQTWKIALNQAVKLGYLLENPANRLELPRIIHEEPVVLSVKEAHALLAATLFSDRDSLLPECRAYLAIGMFAGLRPLREIGQLDWGDINLDARTITVRSASAKARVRRIVTIEPNLVEWLRPIARKRGRVLRRPIETLRKAARAVLGFPKWPSDVMRHTFASYHFEKYHDEAKTKKMLGHHDDGRVFYHHYCKPVYPIDAETFWSIRPPVALLSWDGAPIGAGAPIAIAA